MKVLSNIQNNEDAVTKEYVDAKTGISAVDPTSGSIETDFFIPTKTSELTNDSGFITSAALTGKQDTLVSGTNIKTINNESLLGSGNITIQSGGSATDVQVNGTSITNNGIANLQTEGTYNASSNKLITRQYASSHYVAGSLWEDDYNSLQIMPAFHAGSGSSTIGTDLYIESISNKGDMNASATFDMGTIYHESLDENEGYIILDAGQGNITINNEGTQITGVVNPSNSGDAVNKKYVDDAIAAAITDALEASY